MVAEGNESPPLYNRSMTELTAEFYKRIEHQHVSRAAARKRLRDQVLFEAGGTDYDRIRQEFEAIARSLGWPREATAKDFPHLFLTTMSNAGLSEPYRQFLAGQAQSTAAVTNYTHLDQVREQYTRAVKEQWPTLLKVVARCVKELGEAPRASHRS